MFHKYILFTFDGYIIIRPLTNFFAYLLLMGEMPSQEDEQAFKQVLGTARTLPSNFTRDVIMKAPNKDIMNSMTRSILTLASYDEHG